MLNFLSRLKLNNNSVSEFNYCVHQGLPSAVFGVSRSFKNFLVSTVDLPVLYIVKDALTATDCATEIAEFSGKKVVYLPPKDQNLAIIKAFSRDREYERLSAISQLSDAQVIVVTPETLLQGVTKNLRSITFTVDKETNLTLTLSELNKMGYQRCEKVESKGTFAVRGDLIDIFPINLENPVRIDFFCDQIENIKSFSADTRESLGQLKTVSVLQNAEFTFCNDDYKLIEKILDNEIKTASGEKAQRLSAIKGEIINSLTNGDYDALSTITPLSNDYATLFEYLKKDTVVVYDEAKSLMETFNLLEREFTERFNAFNLKGEVFSVSEKTLFKAEDIIKKLNTYTETAVQTLSTAIPFFNPLKIINPNVSGVSNYHLDFKEVYTDIDNWLTGGYKIIAFTGSVRRAENLSIELSARGIASTLTTPKTLQGVAISDTNLSYGFIFHEEKIVVIGAKNLYAKSNVQKKFVKKKQAFFTPPEVGDYCVHETHGIGKVLGVKKISSTESTKDYVAVLYSGGDVLYVPVEQLDVLTRYLGAEKSPKLSKIGGVDFERLKKSVKESIKKMSFDLKKLYNERKESKGTAFIVDAELEDAFGNAFPFEETEDQKACDQDILGDMQSEAVMDRLVCGDVGFGKTEVAFRAIFRAIANGFQAVILAPTTILTEQHYNTAIKRFEGFGVKIACLNRFRSAKEQKQIVEKLKNGEIDLIIGTHRLLSKDIAFKKLGLLVLDEEQRFGVEHKEKIKLLKKNVDAITLTATPIPRTLHMSLSGIRSISTINTPPKKRLPVQTYVTEETDALIKDAILREINRGGQAFILYNRVESIFTFAKRVQDLLPNVKITVVHGQMEEKEMEKNIISFYNGQTQLLISTTIIENGIDLPKANTLIVIDADRLGLSTLYQLKGRVGRSDRLAYAYFTFKREKILSTTAFERLNAIIEFTEMGSGIKIAMRDLEIRGAGNILGAQQHGHMDKIGYELYSKLLKEELTGEVEINPELDVRVTAFIPEGYIESSSTRMETYKEIAELSGIEQEIELKKQLTENYGDIPIEVANLINIACLKRLAMKIGVSKIVINKDQAHLEFFDVCAFKNQKLLAQVESSQGAVVISVGEKIKIEFLRNDERNGEMLYKMRKFLEKTVF